MAMASVSFRLAKLLKRPQGASQYFWILNLMSFLVASVGYVASSLLTRYYFQEGGSLRWLQTVVLTMGFPLSIPLLAYLYWKEGQKFQIPSLKLCCIYIVLGAMLASYDLMYAWGVSYLPASTAGLLISTQLPFTCIFSLILVKQKINIFSWNSMVLVTVSVVILALTSSSDKLAGVSSHERAVGFGNSIGAAALYGLYLPLSQLVFVKVYKKMSMAIVLEFQVYVSFVGTVVPLIGMGIAGEFGKVSAEAAAFGKGKGAYIAVLLVTALGWQMCFVGVTAITFLCSSILAAIVISLVIPFGALFAVAFFHDSFGPLKIIAMLIAIWGFASYFYGQHLESQTATTDIELPQTIHPIDAATQDAVDPKHSDEDDHVVV